MLYSCILPGSGNIIGGRSAVIRTYALDTNLALIARAGLKAALGYNPMSTVSWKGTRPTTRMGALAILRRKLDKVELKHESWRNVMHLVESGVEFGLMSDHPVTPARQLLLQCRWLLRHGYSTQQAIEVITRKNAEILGLGNMLGTLEAGKWASFTCWNGDPFHLTSYPVAVYGEGTLLHTDEKNAHTT